MASPRVNYQPEPSRADRSPVCNNQSMEVDDLIFDNADVDNMESVPSPARSPSAKNMRKKRVSMISTEPNETTRSGSVDTPMSRLEHGISRQGTMESMAGSPQHMSAEQLQEGYIASKLRAARAEAKNEACLRRINQLTQTVQFVQKDKEMAMRAQAEHIENLQWQVGSLAEENAMHKAGKGGGKGSPNLQKMEVALHQKIQAVEQDHRQLQVELEAVRREKQDLSVRRKELEVQCDVLNAKLKGGSERVEQAIVMQTDLKKNLDEQVKLNFSLQQDLDVAQKKNEELEKVVAQKPAEGKDDDKTAQMKKDLKKFQKELQNEKDFIKTLKEKFKTKSDECKSLQKQVKELESNAKNGKGKGKGDQDNLVKELYAQLSSANSGKSTLAAKVYEAEQHITVLEENEKLQIAQVEEIIARHNQEIFEWKRKVERAQDAKVEALNEMRRKMATASQVADQMQGNSLSQNFNVNGKQMQLFTHCLIVGVITLFAMDWFNYLL